MDPELLERLLAEQTWMRRLARALVVDAASADDAVQRAWLALLRSRTKIDPSRRVRGFLATILRRSVSGAIRENQRRDRREAAVSREVDVPSPDEVVAQAEMHRRVVDAVLALDESQRDVILLRWFKDLTPREIAAERGLSVDAVESRLRRAQAKLRDELTRRSGGDSLEWTSALMPIAAMHEVARAAFTAGPVAMRSVHGVASIAGAVIAVLSVVLWMHRDDASDSFEPSIPRIETNAADQHVGAAELERIAVDSETGTSTSPCRIRVVDADLRSTADARILFDSVERDRIVTDDHGEASVAKSADVFDVVVTAPFIAPSRHRVSFAGEACEIRLPAGTSLDGIVLLDDMPVGPNVDVCFQPLAPFQVAMTNIGRAALSQDPYGRSLHAATDEQGRFRFTGLPEGAIGRLSAGVSNAQSESVLSASARFHRAPGTNIVLAFASAPRLCGRVLDPNGSPSPDAILRCTIRDERPLAGTTRTASVNRAGSFEIPLPISIESSGSRVEVTARNAHGDEASVELMTPLGHDSLLGDLRLEAAHAISFHVHDELGAPIARARIVATDDPSLRSEPSDEAGIARLSTLPSRTDFVAIAPGFEFARVSAGGRSTTEGIDVAMHTTTRLQVDLEPAMAPWRFLYIAFESEGALLGIDLELERIARSISNVNVESSERGISYSCHLFDGGHLEIDGLRPGVEWSVRAISSLTGRQVARARIRLGAGEARHLSLVAPISPRALDALVVDDRGMPLIGAAMSVRRARGTKPGDDPVEANATTDVNGHGRVECILSEEIDLDVTCEGFASQRVSGLRVPAAGATVAITLQSSRPVEVRVIDAAGRPVPHARLRASVGPTSDLLVDAEEISEGSYLFLGLPEGRVDGEANLSGLRIPFTLETTRTDNCVVAPITGSLRVHLPQGVYPPDETLRVRLTPLDGNREQVVQGVSLTRDEARPPGWEFEVPFVLPGRVRLSIEGMSGAHVESSMSREIVVGANARVTLDFSRP